MHDDTDAGRLIPVNQPALAIDYLGSSWKNEDDIAASWKFMTKQKHDMINGLRLENASWRNWAKQRHNLKTISPKVLNWLKDSDTTWLYGPLYKAAIDEFDLSRFGTQTVPNRSGSVTSSSSSIPSTTTVGADGKPKLKPVLKRKTASELFKADTLFHVQSDGRLNREIQPYSKATESAVFKEHRQPKLRFNDSVEQCVSIDNTDAIDEEDEDEDFWNLDGSRYRADNDDESSAGLTRRHEDEDGGILMRISAKKPLRSIVRIDPTRLKAASLHGMEDDDDDENQGFPEDATDEDEHEQEDSLFDESIYLANPYTTNGTGHSRSSSTQQYGVEHYERSYHDENDAAMGEISYTRPSPPSSSSDSRTQETAAERAAITTTAAAESDAGASKPEADNTAMTNGGFHQRAQSLVTNVKGLVHWASSFVYNNNNNHHQHP
ncbi:hypothetical protein BG011_008066 [Mortierella polycephala]|uniref:Nitrogen regulatory protein areA GATA-like domain-containing protein n=1 Tax=Mortierella polycephala TaxID=41804 RepID=A0A9P6PRV7_9FUNG|nr:hypothetical protein BG011_008066 [Mortierella polycephala]